MSEPEEVRLLRVIMELTGLGSWGTPRDVKGLESDQHSRTEVF